jgi:hypothetical protein
MIEGTTALLAVTQTVFNLLRSFSSYFLQEKIVIFFILSRIGP